MIDAISHGVDNHKDRRLWDCFEGNEAVKGTERDRNDLRILRCAPHENGAEEVIGLWPVCRGKAASLENVRVYGWGTHWMQDLRSPVLEMPSGWPTTSQQPCNDVSVEIGELDRATNTSLTSGCLRFVSLDRDYSHLSMRVETDNSKRAPAAP